LGGVKVKKWSLEDEDSEEEETVKKVRQCQIV